MKFLHSDKKPVYAMSFDRQTALSKLRSNQFNITDTVIRCIVYGQCNAYRHWVEDKLGTWFKYIADIQVKKMNRFDVDTYSECVFGGFGNSPKDCKSELQLFKLKVENDELSDEYHDFDITLDLVSRLFSCAKELDDYFSHRFAYLKHNEELSKSTIIKELHEIMDKYCDEQ